MKKMIKKISILLALAMLISSIQPSNVFASSKKYVKSFTVSKKSLQIKKGKSKTVSFKIRVKGKASKEIRVKASNSKVKVTISKTKIKVYAKKIGSCKLTFSTRGRDRKGKRIKRTIKVKVTGKSDDSASPTGAPAATADPQSHFEVSRSEWIHNLMDATGYKVQEGLFRKDEAGNVKYSYIDIARDANAGLIETAAKYGFIPFTSSNFRPNDAADREFVAVTAVRAVGLALESATVSCNDRTELKYETEDAVAVRLKLISLINNSFLPAQAVTKAESNHVSEMLTEIIQSRAIDENHKDVIEYSDDVSEKTDVKDYEITENNRVYTVTTALGSSLDEAAYGDKIVLPETEDYPEGLALFVSSSIVTADGKRSVSGIIPEDVSDFVEAIDIEGNAEAKRDDITAVAGVATVEVAEEKDVHNLAKKKANLDGLIDLKDKTKISYTIKELETTISFYLSELEYRIDFDKKGVNELYIGLPNVLSMDTEYKASKTFDKKIGEIHIEIKAGFSADIEVFLEAEIGGEIKMNFKLSNNLGVQYLNGEFYLIKSCEPSFDLIVDADLDAGVKLQLGLYWMKKLQEIFGKNDPRPLYNVYTKWGMHGDATLQIRNDKHTNYESLFCVDLGYYLYGKVSIGDGSFLGDKFNLKKIWDIFDKENSPLKGQWHLENGKKVVECTYNKIVSDELFSEYVRNYDFLCDNSAVYDIHAYWVWDDDAELYGLQVTTQIDKKPLTYDIADFDGDGQKELLIVNTAMESSRIYDSEEEYFAVVLQMYEIVDGKVELSSEKACGNYDQWADAIRYITACRCWDLGGTTVFKYSKNSEEIIAVEENGMANVFADGLTVAFNAVKYDGQTFIDIGRERYEGSDYEPEDAQFFQNYFRNIGITLDAEQILDGHKHIRDYIKGVNIIGKSDTEILMDSSTFMEMQENEEEEYRISRVRFMKE